MACPTRTPVAVLMPMGTMKVKLAQSRAIWCPARGRAPKVEMMAVTAPKMAISTKIWAPMGPPRARSSRRRAGSQRHFVLKRP
jgi:hypothetical protein